MRGKRREVAGYASVGEAIIALRRKGLSREEIAARVGTDVSGVTNRINWMVRNGQWPEGLDTAPRAGGRRRNAVDDLRRAYRARLWVRRVTAGDDPADIAREYGVLKADVVRVCREAGVWPPRAEPAAAPALAAEVRAAEQAAALVLSEAPAPAGRLAEGVSAGASKESLTGLNPQQLAEADRLRRKGWSVAGLAKRYGVPVAHVAAVFNVTVGRAEG